MYVHVLMLLNLIGQKNAILDYIEIAFLAGISAKDVYAEFVNLLPEVVDANAEARIKSNATKPRRVKVKYDNVIKFM